MPKIYLEGPAGKLEGMLHMAENPKSPTALVLHPNPLYGGTMNNKITYHLYKAFVNNGFSVLRINFRGVGGSAGKFANGVGELEDVNATLDWLRSQNPCSSHYWLAGFSFGAFVAMQSLMRRPEIENFILVSPPASRYNCNFFYPCPISGLIVQGSEDGISKPVETEKLAEMCKSQKGISILHECIQGADHFFSGDYITDFDEIIHNYIQNSINSKSVKSIIKVRKRIKSKTVDFSKQHKFVC